MPHPIEATVRRVAGRVDGDILDDVISSRLAEHDTSNTDLAQTAPAAIAVDGKSWRGTFARTAGAGVHLLAAITHETGGGCLAEGAAGPPTSPAPDHRHAPRGTARTN
jgi:hypothetical protein